MNKKQEIIRMQFISPHLVFVMGPPGVGKTVIARELLRLISTVYIDNNALADPFYSDTRKSKAYLEIRPKLYKQFCRLLSDNLKMGNSILIDAPFVKQMMDESWRTFIREFSDTHRAKMVFIKCHCPIDELKKRLIARGEPRDKWKLENWDRFTSEEPMDYHIPFDHIDLNTTDSPKANADKVVNCLKSKLL